MTGAAMKDLLRARAPLTMTSREIADLVEKRHDHVIRDIENMLAGLGSTSPQFWGHLPDAYNRNQRAAFLPKRETLILVSGYSVAIRAKIIDRWQELEAGATLCIPLTMGQALRLAAEQADKIEAQAAQLAIAVPKAAFVERYVECTGNMGFREVCKLLSAGEREFGRWLEGAGIMYRLGGQLTPHARHLHAGRFVVKAGVAQSTGHAFHQAKFTPKGVNWIAGEWAKNKIKGVAL